MHDVLTLQEVSRLATILEWCQSKTHVRWENPQGDIVGGTVRSIGNDTGNFLRADAEIRDAYVRITCDTGFEWFAPVHTIGNYLRKNLIAADR